MGLIVLYIAGGTAVVAAAALVVQVLVREYWRRHPDPAWKPTGYRIR